MKKILLALSLLILLGCAGTRFNWDDARSLKVGMTTDEVKEIMGPPYSVTTKGDLLIYVWVHANGMTGSSRSMALPFKDGKLNAAPNIPKEF